MNSESRKNQIKSEKIRNTQKVMKKQLKSEKIDFRAAKLIFFEFFSITQLDIVKSYPELW